MSSVRSAALGGSDLADGQNPSVQLVNPAGLGLLPAGVLSLQHQTWFAGTFQDIASCALPAGGMGGFGLEASYLNWGFFDIRGKDGNKAGSYTSSDLGLGLGWGKEWFKGLALGFNAKTLQQKIAWQDFWSYSGDAGLIWRPTPSLGLAAYYGNFGSAVAGIQASASTRLGAAWNLSWGPQGSMLLAFSGAWEGGAGRLMAGAEAWISGLLALRAGYRRDLSDQKYGSLAGLSCGLGMKSGPMSVDYALQTFGDLGLSHRIALNVSLAKPKAQPAAPVPAPTPFPTAAPTPSPISGPAATPTPRAPQVVFSVPPNPLAEASSLRSEGRLVEAIAACHRAIKANRGDAAAWSLLGDLYVEAQRPGYAKDCYAEALKIEPLDAKTREKLNLLK